MNRLPPHSSTSRRLPSSARQPSYAIPRYNTSGRTRGRRQVVGVCPRRERRSLGAPTESGTPSPRRERGLGGEDYSSLNSPSTVLSSGAPSEDSEPALAPAAAPAAA